MKSQRNPLQCPTVGEPDGRGARLPRTAALLEEHFSPALGGA